MAKKKIVTAAAILQELDRILEKAKYYQSRQSGKRFYDHHNFPSLMTSYVAQSGLAVRTNAKRFGMSPGTLENLMAGGPLSDNMLLRIRTALVAEVGSKAKASVFAGDWHDASPARIAAAISTVSEKLVFLKKVIESNNFLQSEKSPIDKIQVLQLIALLMATLEALRAPFIDKKQTRGFFRWLGKLAKTSAQKGIEKLVVDAMGDAVNAGTELIHRLSSVPTLDAAITINH
jgi:hypothetical protein